MVQMKIDTKSRNKKKPYRAYDEVIVVKLVRHNTVVKKGEINECIYVSKVCFKGILCFFPGD